MKKYNNPAKHFLFSIIMTGVIGFFVMSSVSNTNIQTNILNPDTTSVEENQEQKTTPEIRSAVGTYYDGISSSGSETSSSSGESSNSSGSSSSSENSSSSSESSSSGSSSSGGSYSGAYYNSIDGSLSGTALRSQLASLMINTHTTNTTYSGLATVFKSSDVDPNNPNKILWFYTGTSVSFSGFGGSSGDTNREHVWPKDGGAAFPAESGPGSDSHHLRPTETNLNSTRGSLSFAVVDQTSANIVKQNGSSTYASGDYLCYKSGSFFYPGKGYRGQTARILFYMQARWGNQYNLSFVDSSGSSKTIGKLSDLLKWNLEEPISNTEITRNEVVYGIQGNRNAFIDYPEYACKIWGDTNSSTRSVCAAYSTPTITLDKSTASVNVGNTTTLVADVTNSSSSVAWSSSATSIATVNSSGVVTGVSTGTAVITASITESSVQYTATCTITVNAAGYVTLTGVSLNITSGNLDIGETLSLTTTVSPSNSYPVPSISWSSSNSNVASISNGLVTAVAAGSVTITATATQNAVTKTATCSITVNAAPFVPTTTYSQGGTGTTATLVTDVANLSVGDSVLILNTAGTYALSTTQNGNNRGAVGVSTSGGVLSTIPETAQIMTLEAGTVANTFAFNTGTAGYLYAASSSKNYLRSQTTNDANGSWVISIASGGEATVTAQGTNTRNLLRYNSSNLPTLFSAYSTGQENVNIYEVASGYNYNYLLGVLDGDYCTMDLTNLNLIYTRYNAMTSTEIEHFNVSIITGADSNSYTGLEAYSQAMLRRVKLQSEATTNFGLDFQINDQLVSLVIVISGMAFLSITSFFLLKKKNS